MKAHSGHLAPPQAESGAGRGRGGWRHLTTARDHFTAHLIEGLLSENGLESHLDTFDPAPGAFLKPFGDPMAPVRVFVRQGDFEEASLLLHEVGHVPPDPDAAPSPRLKWMWAFTIAVVLIAALLGLLEILGFAPCAIRLFCF